MKHFFYLILLLASILVTGPAVAGAEHNLSGWAWTDTVGWISFNCTNVANECANSNYGVHVADDGAFSGYAWSPNIGWINFNDLSADTGRPASYSAPRIQAWINFNDLSADTGRPASYSAPRIQATNVIGFAKILSLENGGWLSFKDATYNMTTRQLSGWMWNKNDDGSGIGWVELRNVVRSVPPNNKPNTPTAVKPKDNVDIATLNPAMTVSGVIFKWSDFFDPDAGDTQQAYEISIVRASGGEPFTRTVQDAGSSFAYSSPTLVYNTEYHWKVRVEDNHGEWSEEWPTSASFRTPKHALPAAQFTTPEISPGAEDAVQFTDASEVFDGRDEATAWVWDFGDGTRSTDRNPTHIYPEPKEYNVCLTATDSDGYTSTKCTAVGVTGKKALPVWQRIIPF